MGLVLDLGAAQAGTFTFSLGSGPYQVKVYGAPDGNQPATFSAWGPEADKFAGSAATTETVTFSTPVRYVLRVVQRVRPRPGCSKQPVPRLDPGTHRHLSPPDR